MLFFFFIGNDLVFGHYLNYKLCNYRFIIIVSATKCWLLNIDFHRGRLEAYLSMFLVCTYKYDLTHQLRQALLNVFDIDSVAALAQGMRGSAQAGLGDQTLGHFHHQRQSIVAQLRLIVLEGSIQKFFDNILNRNKI